MNISSHQFHPTVLREYDIRGVVGETLSPADAYEIGRTFASIIGDKACFTAYGNGL